MPVSMNLHSTLVPGVAGSPSVALICNHSVSSFFFLDEIFTGVRSLDVVVELDVADFVI